MRRLWPMLSLLLLVIGCQDKPAPVAGPAEAPKAGEQAVVKPIDQMRQPWVPSGQGCIRDWVLLGPIEVKPAPPTPAGGAPAAKPLSALETDYLAAAGGEAKCEPKPGQACKLPDGRALTWQAAAGDGDVIDFHKELCHGVALQGQVAYAFTTYTAAQAGKALMAAGSDDGIRIWVNGKLVHDIAAGRKLVMDEDLVEVDLQAGANRILVKIDQGGGRWEFCLRVLSQPDSFVRTREMMAPSIVEQSPAAADAVTVRTDLVPVIADAAEVKLEVVAPGGKRLADHSAKRGALATFKTADWPEGPCEIQLTTYLPNGTRVVRVLPYFKGDHVAQVRKVIAAIKADPPGPHALIANMIGKFLQMQLDRQADPAKLPLSWVHSALMEYAEITMCTADKDVRVRPGGFVRLAWTDEVDGSAQFARAYLPPEFDPAKQWPLVVNLHGHNPINQVYWDGWGSWDRQNWVNIAQVYGVIVVEPMGRYNTGYRGIGELDVLRSITEAEKLFKIDPDRVLLTGFSMGGGGTWHVGTLHPELFAGIAPLLGGWDWHSEKDPPDVSKLSPRRVFDLDRWSSYAGAESLLTTPVFVGHGDADEVVDVNGSRYGVRMLQRWGYDVRYWEHPGGGHADFQSNYGEILPWFLALRRDANPREARVHAARLKDASAHWLKVQQSADPCQWICANAEIVGPNLVYLETQNVLEVALSPAGPMIDQTKPLRVIWNDKDRTDAPFVDGKVVIRHTGYQPVGLVKRPAVEGPAGHVTVTPFAIVIGTTAPDPLMRKMIAHRADVMIRAWQQDQHCRPRVYSDTELTPEDMKKYSLVLLGGPADNAVTKQLIDKLPLTIDGKIITIDGRCFGEPNAAVQMAYPHPLNPDRYVLVTAANSPAGMYLADFPDDYDYCVMDGRVPDDDAGRPFEKVVLGAGLFDNAWRLDPKFGDFGEPAVRAKCPLRKAPRLVSAISDARELALSDLLESSVTGSFTLMQRGLNARGHALRLGGKTYDDGIGVRVRDERSVAEYDLSGAGWKHLTGLVGIDVGDVAKLTPANKENTLIGFVVKGDGKELFRSKTLRWDSPPQPLAVDITGVKSLTLQVYCENVGQYRLESANWVNLRLAK